MENIYKQNLSNALNMKSSSLFIVLSFTFFMAACGGSPTDKQGKAIEATGEKPHEGFSFDLAQHEITYAEANVLIDNYCKSVIYAENPQSPPVMVSKADFRRINVNAFKLAFPQDDEENRTAIRITLGLNIPGKRLEYYLSPVKFGPLQLGDEDEGAVDFLPADTAKAGTFDFLKNEAVFHVKGDGSLARLTYESDEWKSMEDYWKAYKSAVFFKGENSEKLTPYIPGKSTRSILIPTQVVYSLIESQKPDMLRLTSVIHFFDQETQSAIVKEARHSIVFSGNTAAPLQIEKQLTSKTLAELMQEYNSGCTSGRLTPTIKKRYQFSDLSPEELAFIDLKLKKNSSEQFGIAANYAQLCPAKCLQLVGTFEPTQRVLRLKGMVK